MSDERIEFYRHDLGDAELASVRETLDSLFLTLGPRVTEFEERFATWLGVPHVVGVSSCTMALLLALRALGVGPGDEVITTPMTFVATTNAILHTGAIPVFADVDPATGLLDPAAAAAAVTPRTRAIVAVHLYGQMADVRALRALADGHGLALVEDTAHAVEAERDGLRPGHLGDAATFSFYATKTLTAGDGGAIAVRDPQLATRLRRLRDHGVDRSAASRHGDAYVHWDMVELGYKAALTDLQAALLLPQLPHLKSRRDRRAAIVARYERGLAGRPGIELLTHRGHSAHHLMTALVPADGRDAVLAAMGQRGIGVAVNYRAVHTLTYYKERFGHRREAFPHAAAIGDRTISLPLWTRLDDAQVDRVIAALCDAVARVS